MRTGKERKFALDDNAKQSSEELRSKGKGLVGGDIERIPHVRKGLAPFINFPLTRPVELRRFPEDEAEVEEAQSYLAYRPLEVEVGFGGGNFLLQRAINNPEVHFVGFEIRRNLCLSVVKRIESNNLTNLRVIYEDVRQSMDELFADQSIRRCSVFFPDPWWKKRHVKRRVLTPFFLDLMEKKLVPNGMLHIKTDVMPYADVVEELFAEDKRYQLDDGTYDWLFENDFPTEREEFCAEKDIPFREFRYVLKSNSE